MLSKGVRRMLDFLSALEQGQKVTSAEIEAIAHDPNYRLLLQRWRWWEQEMKGGDDRGMQPTDLVECLRRYSAVEAWNGHKRFDSLITALDQARSKLADHETVYREFETLQIAELERDVLECLPEGAHIQTDLYFLAESHPSACVFEGDIITSFFPLTLEDGRLNTVAGPLIDVVRHELHHIGIRTVSQAFEYSNKMPDSGHEYCFWPYWRRGGEPVVHPGRGRGY